MEEIESLLFLSSHLLYPFRWGKGGVMIGIGGEWQKDGREGKRSGDVLTLNMGVIRPASSRLPYIASETIYCN